jgi:hypothetical protein
LLYQLHHPHLWRKLLWNWKSNMSCSHHWCWL